jgi:hypothetical protein
MRYFLFLALFLSFPSFAAITSCPQAVPVSSPNFCSSFQTAAVCHCTQSGLPESMCQDLNELYVRMIAIFGSVEQACFYQQDTAYQTCVDDWNCYRSGGTDSQGHLCSSNGNKC